ncbi:hypothetical protein [Halobacillus naozhouensis]|uniref:Uncharacterized protein n=1 Tax=Halobacillus naozhouensis TaxID=554880 RepID=A0ABY8J350_9BACI|nr:hypothetical protein [Halobacillus naozhouensis]WFT76516.1 hypothetical protein P9989_09195 [Halobacillus naozhouensis]
MKTVKVPVFFHELFGKRIALLDLWLTILFCIGMTVLLLTLTYSDWQDLAIWRVVILIVFIVDITGGVIANFSFSTNFHYKTNARGRLVFIAIHVQPIIFAWLFGGYYGASLIVWGYTIISALIVNALIQYPGQRMIGVFLAVSGVSLLLLFADIPQMLMAIFSLYMFKVIFGFAVDHDLNREGVVRHLRS